jgi:hypothetical protein
MAMSPRLLRPRTTTGFNPKMLSGLAVWYDGADASTFTLNGSNVSQWDDKSGNNRHGVQATAGSQPAYGTWSAGKRSLDNSDFRTGFLSVSSGLGMTRNIGAFCISAAIRVAAASNGQLVFLATTPVAGSRIRLAVNENVGGTGGFSALGRRLDADAIAGTIGGTSPVPFADYIVTGVWDFANATARIYSNGTLLNSNTSFQTAGNTSDTNAGAVQIMGLGAFFYGQMGELVAYTTLPSDAARIRLERYLGRKWGVTVA